MLALSLGCSAAGQKSGLGTELGASGAAQGSSRAGATTGGGGTSGAGVGSLGGAASGGLPPTWVGPSLTDVYPESVLCPPPVAPPAGELSQGFANQCAGCHGPDGTGKASGALVVPSLKKLASLEEFKGIVRSGRIPASGLPMPAFAADVVPDAQLEADFAALGGGAMLVSADPACGPGALSLPRFDEQQLRDRIARGMQAFRRQGPKGACAGCHSAAAIDMAFVGYSDAAILRRASTQVSADDAQAIVELVHALRVQYAVDRPLHPERFRFGQPGHEVLPEQEQAGINLGSGPGYHDANRDRAFARYLTEDVKLLLAGDTIQNVEQAKAVEQQLTELDLSTLKIGIKLELWTEDGFRGDEHNVPTEWIPMLSRRPASGREAEWDAIVDGYRADPSDANLWKLYDAVAGYPEQEQYAGAPALTQGEDELSGSSEYEHAARWSLRKYLSVQVASHMLLKRSLKLPDLYAGVPEAELGDLWRRRHVAIRHNPFWRVGDSVRFNPLNCNTPDPCTKFPPALDASMNAGDGPRERQTLEDKQSWFWLGYIIDPALLETEDAVPTTNGDYFLAATQQYFNVHNAFLVADIMARKANAPEKFKTLRGVSTVGHGMWASPRPFLAFKHSERELHQPPPADLRFAVHQRMWSNLLRMALFLMNDELARTGQVFDRARTLQNVKFMRHWFGTTLEVGADHAALDALVGELIGRLNAAAEIGTVVLTEPFDTLDPVVLPELP